MQDSVYECGAWKVDFARRELRQQDAVVPLGSRAFEILTFLVRSAGKLVERDQIASGVWPGVIVEESRLQAQISAIRKALGRDRDLLKTVSGRGYQLTGDWSVGEPAVAPERQSLPPGRRKGVLPAKRDLIGRENALNSILCLLAVSKVVTLTGPGGIGKTSIALEAARTQPHFQQDCVVVELAPVSDGQLLASVVAGALGLNGIEFSAEAIASAVGDSRFLLVLDNCEHIVSAVADLVETISRSCVNVTILATSREVLRVDNEQVYRVPPLQVPPDDQADRGSLQDFSAVQLFLARIKALQGDIATQNDALPLIVDICRRLDGIPLALEFAAGRVASLGLEEVALRLNDRFNLLTGGRRMAIARHQTLRATLDWSYDLLDEAQQRLLRRLSVFVGWFSLSAAEMVVIFDGDSNRDITGILAELVEKSLIFVNADWHVAGYRLLETTLAYAREKLEESGEADCAARAHASFFIKRLSAAADGKGEPGLQWPADYAPQIGELRAALGWAFSAAGDPELGIALTTASVPIWIHVSLVKECHGYVEKALAALTETARDTRTGMVLSAALAMSLMYIGGDMVALIKIWSETFRIAVRIGDTQYERRALWGLSSCSLLSGDVKAGDRFAARYHASAITSKDANDRHVAARLIGQSKFYAGDFASARQHLEQAVYGYAEQSHAMRVLDQRVMAQAWLSRVLWISGYPDQAVRAMHNAVDHARSTGHALSICWALTQSACHIFQWIGDAEGFRTVVAELLGQSAKYGLSFMHVPGRCYEGRLMIEQGDAMGGIAYFQTAFQQFRNTNVGLFNELLCELAETLENVGLPNQARLTLDQALAQFTQNDEQWHFAECLRIKGELVRGQSAAEAERLFLDSISLARRQGALSWELRSAASLARLQLCQGRRAEAGDLLIPLYDRFEEGFGTADLLNAKALIGQLF